MKSTSDHRDTPFEISSVKQFGDGHGGLEIHAIQRGTTNMVPLRLETEQMSDPLTTKAPAAGTLNERWIELLHDTEHFFAKEFEARTPTREEAHVLVKKAEEAKAAIRQAEELKHQAELAKQKIAEAEQAHASLQKLHEQHASKREELGRAEATIAEAEKKQKELAEINRQIAARRAMLDASPAPSAKPAEDGRTAG